MYIPTQDDQVVRISNGARGTVRGVQAQWGRVYVVFDSPGGGFCAANVPVLDLQPVEDKQVRAAEHK